MDTKKLRQKILDLAIRGKLVPQDPSDEPASLLLERIHEEKERLIKEGKIKRSKTIATDEEIEAPFEIPESWEWVRLEDLVSPDCTLGYGIVQPMGNVLNGIPVVRPVDLTSPVIGIKGLKRIDEKISNTYQRTILKGGEILFCVRASVGKVGIASTQLKGANVTRGISPIRFDYEYLTKYVFCHLQSLFSQTEIKTYSRGATLQQINVEDLKTLSIALPPLAEQQRIVNEVERWFAVIDALESNEGDLLKAIDQAKSKILDLAIHGKLVPQDPNDEPAIELLKRINPKFEACDNELDTNQLPDNWCWTTIGCIFNHNTGKALNKSNSQEGLLLPYITTSNVYWNRFDLSEIKKMSFKDSEIDKCTVTKGDLLVCEGGDIGRSAIWNFDYDICIQNHIHRLRAKGDSSHLLYLYVLMFYKWTERIRGKGIGLQGLSSGLLDKLVVPLPPYKEQLRIVAKIEELFGILDGIKEPLEA